MLGTVTDDLRAPIRFFIKKCDVGDHKSYRKRIRFPYDFVWFLYELLELKAGGGATKA